jgi:hypothetical protein
MRKQYNERAIDCIAGLAEQLFIHQGYSPEACFKSAVNYVEVRDKEIHKLKNNHLPPFNLEES